MGQPEDAAPTLPNDALTAMAAAGDMLGTIAEIVVGYRRRLSEGGVGDDVADTMAKDMHDLLLTQLRAQQAQTNAVAAVETMKGFMGKGGRPR